MQICCYSSVKYFAGILISFLPFGNHAKDIYIFFFSILSFNYGEGFLQILLYTIDESVQTSSLVFS
jgi:hypothetical protein